MEFVETHAFSRRLQALLADEEYRRLQDELIADPEAGDKIPGTGGIRKLRWSARGHGKRGGARIVYFWHGRSERLLLLFIFTKNERVDLTADQRRQLRSIVDREYS